MPEVRDDLGRRLELAASPRRIVSLVPNLSETLWWWHLADRVVGLTDFCVAPPGAFEHGVRVRGTKNPDVDRIISLAPDLVVASEEENRELDVRRLTDAGVAVYVTRVRSLADAAASLAGLGRAVGQPGLADGTEQAIRRALDQARPPADPIAAVCPIWRDGDRRGAAETWWLIGGDTFAGDLLETCGFVPALPSLAEARYPRYRRDELEDARPAAVLLPDEPYRFTASDAEVFASWPARVRHLDGTALSWWGPRTPHAVGDLVRLARQLARPRRCGRSRSDRAA